MYLEPEFIVLWADWMVPRVDTNSLVHTDKDKYSATSRNGIHLSSLNFSKFQISFLRCQYCFSCRILQPHSTWSRHRGIEIESFRMNMPAKKFLPSVQKISAWMRKNAFYTLNSKYKNLVIANLKLLHFLSIVTRLQFGLLAFHYSYSLRIHVYVYENCKDSFRQVLCAQPYKG